MAERQLRRWAPIVAIVVVVADRRRVVLVAGGGDDKKTDDGGSHEGDAATAPERRDHASREAKAKGLDVDVPEDLRPGDRPGGDPVYFAARVLRQRRRTTAGPPCRGVTADTIKVVVYIAPENDPILDFITAAIKNDDTNAQVEADVPGLRRHVQRATTRPTGARCRSSSSTASGYARRRGRGPGRRGEGGRRDGRVRRARAARRSPRVADELAAREVICIGCTRRRPRAVPAAGAVRVHHHRQRRPGRRCTSPSTSSKKLAGASRRASPATRRCTAKNRVFGHLCIEVNDGRRPRWRRRSKSTLADEGIDARRSRSPTRSTRPGCRSRRPASSPSSSRPASPRVIFSGDPVAPPDVHRGGHGQDYFPEWIIGPTALVDTTAFARTYDQKQWAHAFGITGSRPAPHPA